MGFLEAGYLLAENTVYNFMLDVLLEKYKLGTYAFEVLWSDLVHEAAERIYKGKTIYMHRKILYRLPRV